MALLSLLCALLFVGTNALNSTYYNPALSGWHSDPSCTQSNGTFYCVTSTFIAFPGLPVYASKDLINWKLISYAWNNADQLPGVSWSLADQKYGMWAPTIREHEGVFYVICAYRGPTTNFTGTIFKSTDPYDPEGWSQPILYDAVYMATGGINIRKIDLETGETTDPVLVWRGTGQWGSIEGPHIYKKDGWYYLLIAEGGTGMDHSVVIARSREIYGPYENNTNNPLLTNRGTDRYFQTVGHADLFQDTEGNWWGICLAIRSGPEYRTYPMGRESVLFPVTWEKDEWPVLSPVEGEMNGWALPAWDRDLPGDGPFNNDPDSFDFDQMSTLPMNNLTGDWSAQAGVELNGQRGLAFTGRTQTDTLFTFGVDLDFRPREVEQEAGVSLFVTQFAHIDLGVVRLPSNSSCTSDCCSKRWLRFRCAGRGTIPKTVTVPIPKHWGVEQPIRLQIQAVNMTHYETSAFPASNPNDRIIVGTAPSYMVSGSTGSYVGALMGIYATCNGAGDGDECPDGGVAYFNKWRYTPSGQQISAQRIIPTVPLI